jgi:hypothetical protein
MQRVNSKTLDRAQPFSFDLEDRTKKLERIAAWRDELRMKLGRACNNVWEQPDYDALSVEQFKLACKGARA